MIDRFASPYRAPHPNRVDAGFNNDLDHNNRRSETGNGRGANLMAHCSPCGIPPSARVLCDITPYAPCWISDNFACRSVRDFLTASNLYRWKALSTTTLKSTSDTRSYPTRATYRSSSSRVKLSFYR
jgi:hypothetical protein